MSDSEPSIKPAPPASALTSLISQLQPEMFNNLMEIIKDVQRNSLQFYVHSPTREDQLKEEIKVSSWAAEFNVSSRSETRKLSGTSNHFSSACRKSCLFIIYFKLIHKVCLCTLTLQEYLLKQGNVEQSPVAFMNQETSDSRLLVIINNKDIAGHVHKVRLNGQSNGSTVVQVNKMCFRFCADLDLI